MTKINQLKVKNIRRQARESLVKSPSDRTKAVHGYSLTGKGRCCGFLPEYREDVGHGVFRMRKAPQMTLAQPNFKEGEAHV